MAIISAFQADDTGSIPVARSTSRLKHGLACKLESFFKSIL